MVTVFLKTRITRGAPRSQFIYPYPAGILFPPRDQCQRLQSKQDYYFILQGYSGFIGPRCSTSRPLLHVSPLFRYDFVVRGAARGEVVSGPKLSKQVSIIRFYMILYQVYS